MLSSHSFLPLPAFRIELCSSAKPRTPPRYSIVTLQPQVCCSMRRVSCFECSSCRRGRQCSCCFRAVVCITCCPTMLVNPKTSCERPLMTFILQHPDYTCSKDAGSPEDRKIALRGERMYSGRGDDGCCMPFSGAATSATTGTAASAAATSRFEASATSAGGGLTATAAAAAASCSTESR